MGGRLNLDGGDAKSRWGDANSRWGDAITARNPHRKAGNEERETDREYLLKLYYSFRALLFGKLSVIRIACHEFFH